MRAGLFALLWVLLFSCTPKTEEVVFRKRDAVVLKEGSFYLSEGDFDYLREEARRLRISVPKRKEVEEALRYYLSRKRELRYAFARMKKYEPLILPVLKKYGLPEELKYLPVVESLYNPFAVSRSGAGGLWQLMPATARRFGLRIDRFVDERFDPIKSTEAASRYLKSLYEEFKDWELVLAAYNCGEGCVRRRAKGDFWRSRKNLPEETRNYVPAFMAVLLIASNPERFGITLPEKGEPITALKFSFPTSTEVIVKAFGLDPSRFKDANPHIKGLFVPAGTYVYLEERLFVQKE